MVQQFTTPLFSSPSDLLYFWSPLVIFLVVLASVASLIIIAAVLLMFYNYCTYGSFCCPARQGYNPCCCPPVAGPSSAPPLCCICCLPPQPPPPTRVVRRRRASTCSNYSSRTGSVRSTIRVAKPRQQIVTFDEPRRVHSISRSTAPIILLNQSSSSPRPVGLNDAPIILPYRIQDLPQTTNAVRPGSVIRAYTVEDQPPPAPIYTRYFNNYSLGELNNAQTGNILQQQQQRPRIFVTDDNPTVSCEIRPDQQREYVLRSVDGASQSGGYISDGDDAEIEISDGQFNNDSGGVTNNSFYPNLQNYDD